MRKTLCASGIAALACIAAPADGRAQDESDFVAYIALNFTPPGAFAPVVTRTMLREAGTDVALRYGRFDFFDAATNNLALTWMRGTGAGSVTLTAGYLNPDCDGCDGHFLAGVGGDLRMLTNPVGTGPGAMLLTVGLSGEVGFGKPDDGTIWSATAGLPLALVVGGSQGLRLAPFLTPGFGYGYISSAGESESGTRAMLGGGMGILGQGGFTVTVGFQKVFIEEGETTLGISAAFRM
jgi:hypothetical protein